jgi:hypothetical protein
MELSDKDLESVSAGKINNNAQKVTGQRVRSSVGVRSTVRAAVSPVASAVKNIASGKSC